MRTAFKHAYGTQRLFGGCKKQLSTGMPEIDSSDFRSLISEGKIVEAPHVEETKGHARSPKVGKVAQRSFSSVTTTANVTSKSSYASAESAACVAPADARAMDLIAR